MSRRRCIIGLLFSAIACGSNSASVSAQNEPWDVFTDTQSTSVCHVINAANTELILLRATDQLVIVTGSDVTIQDTFVDAERDVFFEGVQFGLLDFAEDGDGLRSLWWLSLTGRVVNVDGFTGQPSESDRFPIEFTDAACDACAFWDDQSICSSPDDDTPTISLCGVSVPLTLAMTLVGLGMLGLVRKRSAG